MEDFSGKIEMEIFLNKLSEGIKGKSVEVKILIYDNYGEYIDILGELYRQEIIDLEYTAPGIPRQI